MDPLIAFWVLLVGVIVGVVIGVAFIYRVAITPLHKKIEKLTCKIQSLSTNRGEITEQFRSNMKKYPFSIDNFRIISNPIDGIQFEDDQILFIKFKKNKSKLNPVQNKIKKLVKSGKIKWFEFRTE